MEHALLSCSVLAQSNEDNVARLAVFPFCKCEDYKCQSSPYRLDTSGVTHIGAVTNICYIISNVSVWCSVTFHARTSQIETPHKHEVPSSACVPARPEFIAPINY